MWEYVAVFLKSRTKQQIEPTVLRFVGNTRLTGRIDLKAAAQGA